VIALRLQLRDGSCSGLLVFDPHCASGFAMDRAQGCFFARQRFQGRSGFLASKSKTAQSFSIMVGSVARDGSRPETLPLSDVSLAARLPH